MNTHLSAQEIRSYLARRMTREDHVRTGKHVHQCRDCYQRFLAELETRFPMEIDLDEVAGVRDWHPRAEELAAYLEGPMDELDSDCISLHLPVCAECREKLQSASQHQLEYSRAKRNSARRLPREWGQARPAFFWAPANYLRVAGIAAVLIMVALALWAVLTTPETANVVVVPPEGTAPSSKDPLPEHPTPRTVPRNDSSISMPALPKSAVLPKRGERQLGPRSDDSLASLIAEDLVMPPSIDRLDRTIAVVVRGTRPSIESFSIISPFATLIGIDRPTFRWTPLSGAESYQVTVYDETLHVVQTSAPLIETEWGMPEPLKAGTVYTWTVMAVKGGREIMAPPAPARAEFALLAKADLAKLNRRIGETASMAARGIAYARAGLLDEAEREFHGYLAHHPNDHRVKELLQRLRSWRGIQH